MMRLYACLVRLVQALMLGLIVVLLIGLAFAQGAPSAHPARLSPRLRSSSAAPAAAIVSVPPNGR